MAAERSRLEIYAQVVAEVAAGLPEDEVLARCGLTEATFAELERDMEDTLSAAMEGSEAAPTPFLAEYDCVLREAHARVAAGQPRVSFDDFARAVAAISSGRDPVRALEAMKLETRDVARGARSHAEALAKDPALVERLERARTGARHEAPKLGPAEAPRQRGAPGRDGADE